MNDRHTQCLPLAFYRRDALDVAPDLIGKILCRQLADGTILRFRITEAEAYRGEEDKACHASRGKTPRNAPMYEAGGITYLYIVYGLHWLFNIVTGSEGDPQAVLVRCMEKPLDGPGKWTKAASLGRSDNQLPLTPDSGIWLEDDNTAPHLITLPRVGINYAAEPWKSIPWRWKAGES